MKKLNPSKAVTAVIAVLIIVFAVLIARTVLGGNSAGSAAAAPGAAPAGGASGPAAAGGGMGSGGGAAAAANAAPQGMGGSGAAPAQQGAENPAGRQNAPAQSAPAQGAPAQSAEQRPQGSGGTGAAGANAAPGSGAGQRPQSAGGGNAPGGAAQSVGGGQAAASAPQGGQRTGGSGVTAQGGVAPQGAARNATVVRVESVKTGTIETGVVINGDVLAGTQVSIYPQAGGKLAELRVQPGDSVSRGQILAMVDPSRPGEFYSLSPVVSTISGTVLQRPLSTGDTVSANTAVYVIGDLSSLVVETYVPERFSTAVRTGLSAQVRFEAMPGEVFGAEISEVSPVLDPASRTLRIRLRFSGSRDPRIRAGMFATVSLVTGSHRNVPVIPRSSVINTYGSWIVFVLRENGTAGRREIELGLESEEMAEVVSGLRPGETIVIAGQNFLSDGDPVRVVE